MPKMKVMAYSSKISTPPSRNLHHSTIHFSDHACDEALATPCGVSITSVCIRMLHVLHTEKKTFGISSAGVYNDRQERMG